MARLTSITSRDQVAPKDHAAGGAIVQSRGAVQGPFTMLLHCPELADRLAHLGADRVMIGSDCHFDMRDADPVGSLAAARLDPDARRLIEGYTAARFLRLPGS